MSTDNYKHLDKIICLLKCLICNNSNLGIVPCNSTQWRGFHFNSSNIKLSCYSCNTDYPITDDCIPILWTDELKAILRQDLNSQTIEEFKVKGQRELFSNMKSYERISDDYTENWRRNDTIKKRVKDGALKIQRSCMEPKQTHCEIKYHLDIGCGPGHVLEWLNSMDYTQIGLDVSLTNLRNSRKAANAYVVLGDATKMPFNEGVFQLITGSAVLHHIYDWQEALKECCRVCNKNYGGILFDSEPTVESLSLSLLSRIIFDLRWPAYKVLSYFDNTKKHFRSIRKAREYYFTTEIHNQPGKGISTDTLKRLLEEKKFDVEIFQSPKDFLIERDAIPLKEANWKRIVLHILSGHNPLLSEYGAFTTLAISKKNL